MGYNVINFYILRGYVMPKLFLTLIDGDIEQAKFMDLYNKYKSLMFYVANQILDDNYLAEDAVQEAFIKIAKNFHKINDVSCPETRKFVVTITKNISLTMVKNRPIVDVCTYSDEDLAPASDDPFEFVSTKLLAANISKLPEEYRDILYLYHLYGYSFNEISIRLSLPIETVKKRAQRARYTLKELLEKEDYYHNQ